MGEDARTILIIEDESSLLNILSDEFTEEGFSVLGAQDGAQGLSLALRKQPDIILLDILMPVMDGITMLQWLRKENLWGEGVPIVLLTNLTPTDEDGWHLSQLYRDSGGSPNLTYLQKSECMLSDVVKVVKDRLGAPM